MDSATRGDVGFGTVRDVALSGEAAALWLGNMGWSVDQGADRAAVSRQGQTLKLFGDRFVDRSISLARVWITATSLAIREHHGHFRVLLVVDGEATIRSESWSVELRPWDLVLVDSFRATTIEPRGGFGFMQLVTANDPTGAYHPTLELPIRFKDSGHAQIFASLVNTVLEADLDPHREGSDFLARAIENIVAAIISNSPELSPAHGRWGKRQEWSRALSIIAARHVDPEFNVDALAAAMHMGRRQLSRVLAMVGLTPFTAIRRARLAKAAELRASGNFEDAQLIAQLSGFADLRALRRAERLAGHNETSSNPKQVIEGRPR